MMRAKAGSFASLRMTSFQGPTSHLRGNCSDAVRLVLGGELLKSGHLLINPGLVAAEFSGEQRGYFGGHRGSRGGVEKEGAGATGERIVDRA
jgi:hypothetical protein